jgi:microsomal dipeptidase-like Zn-dependent dipeptidase
MVVDHVGVVTDAWMDGQWTNDEVSGDGVLDGRDRWRAVVTRLWQMGYSTADFEKILGLNLLRVYQRVLK